MQIIRHLLPLCALAMAAALPVPALAQAGMDHSKMETKKTNAMPTDGEVKKVDLEAGKVTIKHAEIKHLDMPSMTMVFTVKDKSLLTNVKTGDKVRFMVTAEGHKMTLTEIELVK